MTHLNFLSKDKVCPWHSATEEIAVAERTQYSKRKKRVNAALNVRAIMQTYSWLSRSCVTASSGCRSSAHPGKTVSPALWILPLASPSVSRTASRSYIAPLRRKSHTNTRGLESHCHEIQTTTQMRVWEHTGRLFCYPHWPYPEIISSWKSATHGGWTAGVSKSVLEGQLPCRF